MASDKINRETDGFVARFERADYLRKKYGIKQYSNGRRSLASRRKTAKAHSIIRDKVLRLAEKGELREARAKQKRETPQEVPVWKIKLKQYLEDNPR